MSDLVGNPEFYKGGVVFYQTVCNTGFCLVSQLEYYIMSKLSNRLENFLESLTNTGQISSFVQKESLQTLAGEQVLVVKI